MTKLLLLFLLFSWDAPLSAKLWKLWPKTTAQKVKADSQSVYFSFPKPPETVHYFVVPFSGSSAGATAVQAHFQITASPGTSFVYPANGCDSPPKTRLYLEAKGWDDPGCVWSDPETPCQYLRWFSNYEDPENPDNSTVQVLAPGKFTIIALLDPSEWSSVFGRYGNYDETATAAFYAAVANLSRAGFPFGGGCFFGHGVSVQNGTAEFRVFNFSVN